MEPISTYRWAGIYGGMSGNLRRADFMDLVDWADYWLDDFRLAAHWRLDETVGRVVTP